MKKAHCLEKIDWTIICVAGSRRCEPSGNHERRWIYIFNRMIGGYQVSSISGWVGSGLP